jgi:hypothetical protein
MSVRVLIAGVLLALAAGCSTADPDPAPADIPPTEPSVGPYFEDVTDAAGLTPGLGSGPGVAVADFNDDGWPDFATVRAGGARVFLNNQDGTFTDPGWAFDRPGGGNFPCCPGAISVVAGDADGDGDADLFVGTLGSNSLFENLGDSFVEVGVDAGIAGGFDIATVGHALADWDGDGDLDVYEANGTPLGFDGAADRMLRNDGDLHFTDVSDMVPADLLDGAAFAASWSDFDQDGDPDVYVVNDFGWRGSNQLLINDGAGPEGWTFTPSTPDCGCLLQENGMGVTVGDFDRDGLQDIFMGNGPGLPDEQVSSAVEQLMRNIGGGVFVDATVAARAYAPRSGDRSNSWGVQFLDVDNDMWPDLFLPFGWYAQPEADAMLINRGGFFEFEGSPGAGTSAESRSVGLLDFDRDGCLDLLITSEFDSLRLYRNLCETGHHFLQIELEGVESNRDAVGAVVHVTAAGLTQREEVFAGSTSSHSSRWKVVHVGLGNAPSADVQVTWPSGLVESFEDVSADRLYRLVEGQGELVVR